MTEDEVAAAVEELVAEGLVEEVPPDAAPPPPPLPAKLAETAARPPAKLPERIAAYRELGWWLANAEGTRTAQAGAAGALRFYYADALELPPLAAQELWIDGRGKLNVSSQLQRAVAESHGYQVVPMDWTDEACTAVLFLEGVEIGRYTYTIQQARRAGLVRERGAYMTDPDAMMFARSASRVLRIYVPGLMLGLQSRDEMEAARGMLRASAYEVAGGSTEDPGDPPLRDGDYPPEPSEADADIPF